ncbi:MAG: PH domain-containing protein [Candidatus Fimenecus sp.]
MSYAEKSVLNGELVVAEGKVSAIAILPAILFGVLSLIISFILLASDEIEMGFSLIFFSVIVVGIAIIIIKNTQFTLTNKKITGKAGVIRLDVVDIPLSKINTVAINQSTFGRMFGYGTLIIGTSSGNKRFRNLANPQDLRVQVLAQISEYENTYLRKQAAHIANVMIQQQV